METNACFLSDPRILWFALGFIFIIAEFIIPGVVIVFFGAAAWIISLLCFVMPVSFNAQLLIFLITSVSLLLIFRGMLKEKLYKGKMGGVDNSLLEDEFIGKTAEVTKDIKPPSEGQINFKGANWSAVSEETISAGEVVEIVGKDSIKLIVKKINNN